MDNFEYYIQCYFLMPFSWWGFLLKGSQFAWSRALMKCQDRVEGSLPLAVN